MAAPIRMIIDQKLILHMCERNLSHISFSDENLISLGILIFVVVQEYKQNKKKFITL